MFENVVMELKKYKKHLRTIIACHDNFHLLK